MATNDEIHRDLYDKVNANTNAVTALAAQVTANNERFGELLELVERDMKNRHREILALILFALFLVGIIGYGAVGKDGLYTVRQTVPIAANGQTGAGDDARKAK